MFIDASKLLFYQERFKERRPITAEMMLTNFCNYDCPYCQYKHGTGYFTFERFKDAVEVLRGLGVRGFNLTGGGEPLLNPEIDEILSWLDEQGISYGINTNFTRYVNCKAKWIKVSLHQGHDLSGVIENMKRFRKENKTTTLGAQIIVESVEDVWRLWNAYKDLDVDYIAFRPIEMPGGYYKDVRDIVEELEAIDDKKVLINYKWYYVNERCERCYADWTVITVDWNGNVWYCCHKPDEVVGNLFKDDVLEAKRKWVTDMSKCDIPCRHTANNIILKEYREPKHVEFI